MVALVGPNCSPSRRSHDSVDSAMVIARASQPALQFSHSRPTAIAVSITGTVAAVIPVWVAPAPTPPPWKAEVADKDDIVKVVEMMESMIPIEVIESVETTEPIISIEVSVAKASEARG
jgi:hypothetical protein